VGRGFGDLETVVMDRLWAADGATTVREVLEQLQRDREIAYTTVQSTMDNLHRKGWLTRHPRRQGISVHPRDDQGTVQRSDDARCARCGWALGSGTRALPGNDQRRGIDGTAQSVEAQSVEAQRSSQGRPVSVAACLLLYAAVVGVVAPRVLPRLTRTGIAPAAAVSVWLIVLMSVLVSWAAAATSLVIYVAHTWNQPHPLALGACLAALRSAASGHSGVATQAGLALTAAVSAFLLGLAILVGRSLLRARTSTRRHTESARILGRRIAGVDGLVIDAPQKMAYCLGGRRGTIVITSAALAALQPPHLDAVLTHERAHLTGHHHLLLAVTRALATSLPRIRLFTVAQMDVARLLEMCADDSAIRRHGPTVLLSALLTLAGADAIPSPALGASTVGIVARVSRLAEPNTTARRLRAIVLLGAAAGLFSAPRF